MRRSQIGGLYLAGACLSAYGLLWQGGLALIAAMAGRGIMNLNPADRTTMDIAGLATLGAVAASSGLCLTLGLLVLAVRGFLGKPHPRRRTVAIAFVLAALFVASATFLARRATAPTPMAGGRVAFRTPTWDSTPIAA